MTTLLLAALMAFQNSAVSTTVFGRVTVDDGSPLPTVNTFRGPGVLIGLQASLPGTAVQVASASLQPDGTILLPLTLAGESGAFSLTVVRIPMGYYVKSMGQGSTDLLKSPFTVTSTSKVNPIEIVLTKTPPLGMAGFKVSGRAVNWNALAGATLTVSFQSTERQRNGASLLRIGNTTLKGDGTFEISGVPPGHYSGITPNVIEFDVVDHDVRGLELTLGSGALSIVITSSPLFASGPGPRPSAQEVRSVSAAITPPQGTGAISVSQSGRFGRISYEGAISFFRIEKNGTFADEKILENSPVAFTVLPGSYVLRAYSRGCDGNCNRLGSPEFICSIPVVVTAGEAIYVERVLANDSCTLRVNTPPAR